MKKLSFFAFAMLAVLLLSSCKASKNVAYIQNSDSISYEQSRFLYDARIMPKDQLTISVNTVDPEVSMPYNLLLQNSYTQGRTVSTSGGGTLMPYLVDNDGYINFPVIGRLHVSGLTKSECENLILEKIRRYMAEDQNPVVTVRMSSYSISVLGEVNKPGSFQVAREKINILEALAQAGDLTIYGVRENVKLIREDSKGKKQIYHINLNDANLLTSPYYYLQQNDIVYVEPNKVKARNSSIGQSTTLWISATSILVSIAALVVNILK
jgi:polysaccharide export outer membrane protein